MIRSFLITAWRNLTNNRRFSLLNILGLAIGSSAAMLVLVFLQTETRFDKHLPDQGQIFRMYEASAEGSQLNLVPGIKPILDEQVSGIEYLARVMPSYGVVTDPKHAFEPAFIGENSELLYADPDFPSIIGLDQAAGSMSLDAPQTALISATKAREWFGDLSSAVSESLLLEDQFDQLPYHIVGVYNDLPFETHIRPDILLSYHALIPTRFGWDDLNGFGWGSFFYYLKLQAGQDPALVEEQIATIRARMFPGEEDPGRFTLQPISEAHLDQQFSYDIASTANRDHLLIMGGLGLFLIIIAWLNYVNMATARSLSRSREVGVRKAIGATRGQLILQFLLEAALVNSIAVVLAILLTDIALPYFQEITGLEVSRSYLGEPWFWMAVVFLLVVGSAGAGLYPALFLSSYQASIVIKGEAATRPGKLQVRQALVLVQFVLSMVLLTGSFAVLSQLQFIRQQHQQLSTATNIAIEAPRILPDSAARQKVEVFRQQIKTLPQARGVSLTSSLPGLGYNYGNGSVRAESRPDADPIVCEVWYGDHQMTRLYGLELVAGRNFDPVRDQHEEALLVNETAARQLGFSDPTSILGEMIEVEGRKRVVGVMKDYHHESLHAPIRASAFLYRKDFGVWYTLQAEKAALPGTMAWLDSTFRAMFPGNPVNIFFYDDVYDRMYASDRDFGKTVAVFSSLAILIACLGLVGLALFSAKKRAREISIRKVVGASERSVVLLLSRELLTIVLIAIVLAIPLSWYAIQLWLEQFSYRFSFSLGLFLLPGLLLVVIAWTSVAWQTLRSARANPVAQLRSD